MQITFDHEFEGRLRRQPNGTYSLSNLTDADLRAIKGALSAQCTQASVDAHQPEPHWWRDGYRAEDDDHRVWFASVKRYYAQAVDRLTQAGVT